MLRHKGAEFRLYGGEAVPAPLKGDRLKGRHPEARGFSRVRLHDDMCAYNSYKFGEEMPDWACEHIVSWVYYPGQFDPVYTKEGRKYT